MRLFYELVDDVTIPGRWHLGEVRRGDGTEPRLRVGARIAESNLTAEVTHSGRALDFCLTSFAVPVSSRHVADAVAAIAGPEVQRLPVRIDSQSGYEVLNALRVLPCLDEKTSEFMKWTERDHRADLVGQYRQVTRLRIDTARVLDDAHFFRLEGWLVALIVSRQVKEAMERVGCLGAAFKPVTE